MTWLKPSFTQPFVSSPCTTQRNDDAPDRILEKPALNMLPECDRRKYRNSINNLLSYLFNTAQKLIIPTDIGPKY